MPPASTAQTPQILPGRCRGAAHRLACSFYPVTLMGARQKVFAHGLWHPYWHPYWKNLCARDRSDHSAPQRRGRRVPGLAGRASSAAAGGRRAGGGWEERQAPAGGRGKR